MRMKKGIISISTVAVLILVVFLAVKYVGGREHVAKVNAADATMAQNDNSTSVVNTDKTTNENTLETDTNKMDVAYINDKTNVGIYTDRKSVV